MNENKPFCCRCKEYFPVMQFNSKSEPWRMGEMKSLKFAPKKIRVQFMEWLKSEIHGEGYLCGNCYFDLTDDNL